MGIPWIRDGNRVKSNFKKLGEKWITTKTCHIFFPCHYEEKRLAMVTDRVDVVGIIMILVDDAYAVLSVNAMLSLSPDETTMIEMEGEKYYKLTFDPGSVVMESTKVVKQDALPYQIYDSFISKGRIPWYVDYLDMCRLFETAKQYADVNVGSNPEVMQLMASLIARDKKDRTIYYRQIVKDKNDTENRLVFIPIKSVEYGATNTVNKLGGSYFQTGVISSLNNPTEKVENIESILRY